MFAKTIIAAAAIAISAPAFAGTITPANAQLSASVGVEPGVYSLAQLTELRQLDAENRGGDNNFRISHILDNPAGPLSVNDNVTVSSSNSPVVQQGIAVIRAAEGTPTSDDFMGALVSSSTPEWAEFARAHTAKIENVATSDRSF